MRIVDKGNDIIIEGHLYSLVCDTIGTATIKVYEDNTYLTSVTTDEFGFFHIVIPTSTVGVRNFKLIYEGDSNYTGSESTTIEVTVRDAPVLDEILLVADKLLCQLGERFHFTATCQSQYDDDLANIQVQLKKDGTTIQTVTTGTDGKAYLKFTPNATGSYSITATSGNVSSDPILVVVSEGNIYEIIADLNEFPGTYSKEEIDALLLALKTLLEESKADIGHIHQIGDIPNLQALLDDKVTWEAFYNSGGGGGGGGSVDIVTSWEATLSDSKVASEKLVKNTIDGLSIPTKTSDLTNDGADGTNVYVANNDSRLSDSRTPTSHTHGNLTNDGKVGSNANYIVVTGTGGAITSVQKLGNITYDGKIGSTSGKPIITTTSGTLTTGSFGSTSGTFAEGNHTHSGYISTSSTTGLIKNDGTVMTSGTGSSNYSAGNHTHSGYVSATKVTSWSSTVSDSNVPSEKLVKEYIDNQIGTAIQYIQQ